MRCKERDALEKFFKLVRAYYTVLWFLDGKPANLNHEFVRKSLGMKP